MQYPLHKFTLIELLVIDPRHNGKLKSSFLTDMWMRCLSPGSRIRMRVKVSTTVFSTALGKRRFLRAGNKYFSKVAV